MKTLLFTNTTTLKNLQNTLNTQRNDLIEFQDILGLFYDDTEKIKPNNENQEKT